MTLGVIHTFKLILKMRFKLPLKLRLNSLRLKLSTDLFWLKGNHRKVLNSA